MKYKIPFTKIQSVGNHFVLINAYETGSLDWPRLSINMCACRSGVGADGLLAVLPSQKADFRMRMFNPDGTEDACGNGLRCAAHYYHSRNPKTSLSIEALDGIRKTDISDRISIDMGEPQFDPKNIPTTLGSDPIIDYPLEIDGDTYNVTCVRVGSPHAVIFAPLSAFWDDMPPVSGKIEVHPAFPERINVTWCSVESSDRLQIRTWERAVGPTLGCGSGACSALAASAAKGLSDRAADVTSPGGTLHADWRESGVLLSGTAEIVFEGEYNADR